MSDGERDKTERRKGEEARRRSAGRLLPLCHVLVLTSFLCGCPGPADDLRRLKDQVEAQKARITTLEAALATAQRTADEQQKQIETLQQVEPDRMARLVVPVRIELDRLTGGYDEDGRPGDDGVVAYVQPIDADGHVIKAAGSLRMEVFDLANPPERSLVAQGEWDADHTRPTWNGRMWTHHFTVRCPWPPPDRQPPDHDELTVRVQFTDLLTGKTFTAQRVCRVKLPPRQVGSSE